MRQHNWSSPFVVCVKNDGYAASLEPRKIYQAIPDAQAAAHGLTRVVDESGEDYLYPANYFAPIRLPQTVAQAFAWQLAPSLQPDALPVEFS